MAWIYVPAAVCSALRSDISCQDTGRSGTSRRSRTVRRFLSRVHGKGIWTMPQFTVTSDPSMGAAYRDWLTSLPAASPVSLSLRAGRNLEKMTPGTCGRTSYEPFAWWDRSMRCWRTFQGSLASGTLAPFSATWPRAGMTVNGIVFQRRSLGLGTGGRASGYWPTPKSHPSGPDYARANRAASGADDLLTFLHKRRRLAPTPRAADYRGTGPRGSKSQIHREKHKCLDGFLANWSPAGGIVNPDWQDWYMGWPMGWTAIPALATASYRRWLREFSMFRAMVEGRKG